MNLHENKKLFTDAVLAAAEQLDIKAVYIEQGLLDNTVFETDGTRFKCRKSYI